MEFLYQEAPDGLCLRRCYGLDGIVRLPETEAGKQVTELDGYAFADTVRGRETPPAQYGGEPALCGDGLLELELPAQLRKVGAYAFYNCSRLRALSFWSTVRDWGAGVFTGCSGLKRLSIRVAPGKKSCFKEVLAELRQTLLVDYRDEKGELLARLIFPEFFEESVENTPARIIMREMHGCGHMYRYCFDESGFSFREYDALFPHVKVQEEPPLVAQLSLYRLFWPCGLTAEAGAVYWAYVREHAAEAAAGLVSRGELELLRRMAAAPAFDREACAKALAGVQPLGNAAALAILMDAQHSRFGGGAGAPRRRTFEL